MTIAKLQLSARPKPRILTDTAVGGLAMGLTVLIWAGFALSLRAIGASTLAPADVALIRFGLPALLLLPWLPTRLLALASVKPLDALMILCGGGLPFFFMAVHGGAATSAAHVGAVIAGAAPLAVAVLERRPVGPGRWAGFGLVLLGVVVLLLPSSSPSVIGGGLWLLGAAGLWGAYTLGLRRAGLDAVGCTLLLCLPSSLLLVAGVVLGIVPTHLGRFSAMEALPFLATQGLGVGVMGGLAYALAVSRLGAGRSAAVGALAPALTTLLAAPLLHEPLTLAVLAGVAVIGVGVVLAARDREARSCSRA